MSRTLFYDVESTSMIKWGKPSNEESQPHIASIAALLIDDETRETISQFELVVRPEGWDLDPEAAAVNGLTMEYLEDNGVPEWLAVAMLFNLWNNKATRRVAYNKTFDIRMIRIAAMRCDVPKEAIDLWSDKDANHECAMRVYQTLFGGKQVKLTEAFQKLTGVELTGAHTAMADTLACAEVYLLCMDAIAGKDITAPKEGVH